MNTIDGEKYLSEIISIDLPELSPDPAIEKRLEYVLHLKAGRRQTSGNSFPSLLSGFFSFNHLGIKAGIITGLFLITLLFNKIPERAGYHVRTGPLLADSSYCDTLVSSAPDGIEDLK